MLPVRARLLLNRSHNYHQQEYFSAENSMGVLPLSISLMASQISAITMLGISGESYINGAFVVIMYAAGGIAMPLIVSCYLPVFFEVKIVSIYEVIAGQSLHDYRPLLTGMCMVVRARTCRFTSCCRTLVVVKPDQVCLELAAHETKDSKIHSLRPANMPSPRAQGSLPKRFMRCSLVSDRPRLNREETCRVSRIVDGDSLR